jgi:hydroxymethylglutaryl-CoA reductase
LRPISGFSKLSKLEKINYLSPEQKTKELIQSFWHPNSNEQKIFDEFSENTITNFYVPYGVVPNLKINNKLYCVPMVIEESSVVAAASKSAKFWLNRGGFHTEVTDTTKIGQVHFYWTGDALKIRRFFQTSKEALLTSCSELVANMEKRGGGITNIELMDMNHQDLGYYQIRMEFETCDAMGANFINSVLEKIGEEFKKLVYSSKKFRDGESDLQIVMAILSNYTPDCLVKTYVECPISDLMGTEKSSIEFAEKFYKAVKIAKMDINRATTHNKGIYNGIDAVLMATGNDYRAVEACGHTYASRSGKYQGLSDISLENGMFKFSLELPIALGVVGGLTSLHPMAKYSIDLLERPSAKELMAIVATTGLAQHFGAISSLVTSGIQKGHMKMHLMNILNHLEANESERETAVEHFKDNTVSFNSVRDLLGSLRNIQ